VPVEYPVMIGVGGQYEFAIAAAHESIWCLAQNRNKFLKNFEKE